MTHTYKALPFHPAADIFPLMEGAEFDALVEDVKNFGLRQPIALLGEKILDGRNRYRAAQAAGYKLHAANDFKKLPAVDPVSYVISANIRRRHLTTEQKEELIAKLLAADPSKSNRQVARTVKASPTYVGKVRAQKEAAGDVSTVDTRTDTRGRKQPSHKRRPPTEDDFHKQIAAKRAAQAPPAATTDGEQKVVNLIITAWDRASRQERHQFIRCRKLEVLRAQHEVGGGDGPSTGSAS